MDSSNQLQKTDQRPISGRFSVEKQITEYCAKHKDAWHASGTLQRIEWINSDGTLAVPRSVVRRLQELQNESVLAVRFVGKKRTPEYRWIPFEWRNRYIPSHSQGINGSWRQINKLPQPTRQEVENDRAERLGFV